VIDRLIVKKVGKHEFGGGARDITIAIFCPIWRVKPIILK